MNNIYLVGFMGTGKSVVGRELAKRKKRQFFDLDEFIENAQQQSIAGIFAASGEAYFRELEKKALAEISQKRDCVVACGGGIVLDQENIDKIKQTGVMICLTASVDEIIRRNQGFTHRPLLNGSDPKEKIELLLKARAPYYSQADTILDTTCSSIEEVTEKILNAIKENG